MSENSTRPHSEKGVGPARRPSTRRIGASGLRNKPKWRSMRLKLAAIWRMSVRISRLEKVVVSPLTIALVLTTAAVAWGWYFLDRANGPVIWTFGDGPHPIFGMRGGGSERPFISTLQITGNNRSDEPVSNIDGFLRSNITNKKLPLFF
jgi:hypothetical protein